MNGTATEAVKLTYSKVRGCVCFKIRNPVLSLYDSLKERECILVRSSLFLFLPIKKLPSVNLFLIYGSMLLLNFRECLG